MMKRSDHPVPLALLAGKAAHPATEPTQLSAREKLLSDFGLMTEEDLAVLLNIEVKTLRNRPPNELPPPMKASAQRLYFKDDVLAWLRKRTG